VRLTIVALIPPLWNNCESQSSNNDVAKCQKMCAGQRKIRVVIEQAVNCEFWLLPHRPYSPVLTPSDYHLFPNMKKQPRGRVFANDEERKTAILDAPEGFELYFFNEDLKALARDVSRIFSGYRIFFGKGASQSKCGLRLQKRPPLQNKRTSCGPLRGLSVVELLRSGGCGPIRGPHSLVWTSRVRSGECGPSEGHMR